ncbi:hypothetical protein ONS95_009347 [Cadophora gregata]|uniref:uncharacterized protein n=1 Tax=Cadophora gregata TaxID=51156 RepID=UPI0026DDC8D7|nr:uncharacterized protein ONS95_009347 [Cadophora gregata]KAK0124385.1 hypothetical protein ONS95_009347 [Cadophora gregata]
MIQYSNQGRSKGNSKNKWKTRRSSKMGRAGFVSIIVRLGWVVDVCPIIAAQHLRHPNLPHKAAVRLDTSTLPDIFLLSLSLLLCSISVVLSCSKLSFLGSLILPVFDSGVFISSSSSSSSSARRGQTIPISLGWGYHFYEFSS